MLAGESRKPLHLSYAGATEHPEFPFDIDPAYRCAGSSFPLHTHDYTELVIVTDGHGVHITEDETYPIIAGDVFVIAKGHAHKYEDIRHLEQLVVKYDHEVFLEHMEGLKSLPGYHALFILEPRYREKQKFNSHLRLTGQQVDMVVDLFLRMTREMTTQSPGYDPMVTSLFIEAVIFLSRCYSLTPSPSSKSVLEMGEVISFIERHYQEPITLTALAQQAHLSVNQLLRVFRSVTGQSPIDYLIHLRVMKAMRLMQLRRLTITDAAYHVGFSDSNYFSKQFKRVVGVSPREFMRLAPRLNSDK